MKPVEMEFSLPKQLNSIFPSRLIPASITGTWNLTAKFYGTKTLTQQATFEFELDTTDQMFI